MNKVVFIVGAGGSIPFHFPSGQLLIKLILQDFEIESTITELASFGFNQEFIKNFRTSLLRSNLLSIDQFLLNREEYRNIGKIAIVRTLIKHERDYESLLFTLDPNWLRYLWNNLFSKNSLENLKENYISFITFNYDRVIEHFFFTSIKHTFGLSDEETSYTMQYFPVDHIYGQLGNLQWQNEKLFRSFSDSLGTYSSILELSKEIKIIFEKPDRENVILRARDRISRADKIFLLGNGYHEMNMKILDLDNLAKRKGIIHGTTYNHTASEINQFRSKFPYVNFISGAYDILGYFRNGINLT